MSYNIRIVTGETQIEDMVSRNVVERQNIQRSKVNTTPDVLNVLFLEFINTGAITVTDFLNGSPGQRLHILGDGNTTVQHGTRIFTNTAANKLLATNKVYKFTCFHTTGAPISHKWVEDE